jgi:hypothetical protein
MPIAPTLLGVPRQALSIRQGDSGRRADIHCWPACTHATIFLRQVSVAVLLDNFINYTIRVEEEDKRKRQAEQRSRAEVNLQSARAGGVQAEGDYLLMMVLSSNTPSPMHISCFRYPCNQASSAPCSFSEPS